MNAQHTPGPWQVVRRHPDPETSKDYCEILPTIGGALGEWSSLEIAGLHCADKEIQIANARLIAAAPDLLEALQAYRLNYSDTDLETLAKCETGMGEISQITAQREINARAAIAKATQP